MSTKRRFSRDGDGWWTVSLDGWEDFTIKANIAVVDGLRSVVGLQVTPADPAHPQRITGQRLRHLPMNAIPGLVAVVDFSSQPDRPWKGARKEEIKRAEAKRNAEQREQRDSVTREQVADVWNAAYDAGVRAKRQAVCKALYLHPRTADRYLRQARDGGLLRPQAKPASGHSE